MAALLALAGVLVLWCGSAQAKITHPFVSSFGSFAEVQGVAVESATGTVYVYDGGAGKVYKFDASGKPVNFTATGTNAISVGFAFLAEGEIAVDSSSGPAKGDIYVAHADGSVEIYSEAGSELGELTEESGDPWGEACGVAVDNSGRVYVGLYSSSVNVYVPSANPVTNADYATSLNEVNKVCTIAADSAANVFVDSWPAGPVTAYESSQFGATSASGSIVDEAGSTLAIDPSNDELYVDEQDQIVQYGPHGKPFRAPVNTFASSGSGAISNSYGIAVSGFNSDVYVSDGKGAISVFGPLTFETVPPTVEEEYATDVSATSATLGGQLNPEGRQTTYRFEYGPSASYGSLTPETDAGAGLAAVSTTPPHLQGLQPNTIYHYRLVATNSVGTTYGPDQTFTTQPVGSELALLDGRQWELVSPPEKHGATIQPITETGLIQAGVDGHAISYVTSAPTEAEPEGYSNAAQVLSTRGSQGWSSKDIATPNSAATLPTVGAGYEYRFFSADLSLALVDPEGPFTPLSPEATERTPYIRNDTNCAPAPSTCYTPLLTASNVPPGTEFGGGNPYSSSEPRANAKFVGATADLSHVVIRSIVGLTSAPGDEGGLYEWANGRLQLVSVLPASEGGTPVSGVQFGVSTLQLGASGNARNAVSGDGGRIFWTDGGSGALYMRDTARNETIRIGSGSVRFQGASSDGSRVFFENENDGLEQCVVEGASGLACDPTELAPDLNGVLGASDDGSFVYFVSNSALAPGAEPGTCTGFSFSAAQRCNLYVERFGDSGWESPKLIGVLSGADGPGWAAGSEGDLVDMTARVSPNGRWLAFMSQLSLTGYNSHDALSGEPDEELYLYDADSQRLSCASCNPTGARPTGSMFGSGSTKILGGGDRVWSSKAWLAADVPGWTPYTQNKALHQSRYLSDSGRLFFNSGDALAPEDVNGTWDVYEYEPPGIGGCTATAQTFSARSDGCIGLMSSGASSEQSAFLDASEDGDDVFFMTTSRLSQQDFDTSYDVYDGHVCWVGAPCVSSPVSPPPCSTGDSCKSAPSPQPSVFGAPPSATFAGVGNLTGSSGKTARPKSLTRAQKLHRALRACHRKRSKRKQSACERRVRKRYGVRKGLKKATRGSR